MSSSQKLAIWTDKLNDVLERATLTSEQSSFLHTTLSGLSQSSFETAMSEETTMALLQEAQTYFDHQQTLKIFCTPFDFDESPTFGTSSKNSCHCTFDITCGMAGIGSCEGANCLGTNYGCGFFWSGPCNFICSGVPTSL